MFTWVLLAFFAPVIFLVNDNNCLPPTRLNRSYAHRPVEGPLPVGYRVEVCPLSEAKEGGASEKLCANPERLASAQIHLHPPTGRVRRGAPSRTLSQKWVHCGTQQTPFASRRKTFAGPTLVA